MRSRSDQGREGGGQLAWNLVTEERAGPQELRRLLQTRYGLANFGE